MPAIMGRGASQTPSYPSAIPSQECDIGAFEFGVDLLNDLVTFAPLPAIFQTTPGPGAEGCPVTFEGGAFRFEARLKNKSTSPPLTHLGVQVIAF